VNGDEQCVTVDDPHVDLGSAHSQDTGAMSSK
jgi:hypothetical protein